MSGLRDTPLAAFVELRLRLGLRRLRGRAGVPELVAKLLSYLVVLPAGLLFAGLVGAGTYQAARVGRGVMVDVTVTAVLVGIWQTWTVVGLSLQEREGVELKRFLVYPLRASRVFAYGLLASVVGDPFSIFWCTMLGGAFVGAAAGRPGFWLLPLAGTLLLFAAATAVNVVLMQEVLGRLLRGRRVRSVAIAVLYLGLAMVGAAVAGLRHATADPQRAHGVWRALDPQRVKAAVEWVLWLLWPASLAAAAARRLFLGELLAALPWILALAAAGALATWAAFRLALATARAPEAAGGPRNGSPGSGGAGTWVAERFGPLLERETKHLMRHPLPGVLLLVIPALAGFASWKAVPHIPVEAGEVVRALPLLGFALYTHLATQVFWLNAFGWDRGGARLHFLAPSDLGQVLAAKNGATYLLAGVLYLACAALSLALAGAPPAWALVAAVLLHLGMAPWLYGLGNLVSVLSPRAASLSLQRSGNLPAVSGLAGMAIISGVSAVFGLPVLLALRLDEGWILPAAWAVLGGAGALAYRASLPSVAALLARRREPLLAAVTGDDA
jgi:ABC-2 type transport system permease protein